MSVHRVALSRTRTQGYEIGKNHLGDLNKYLPCLHGFDELFVFRPL
jgi:hypothetical protein